jgi:hypothetical protein
VSESYNPDFGWLRRIQMFEVGKRYDYTVILGGKNREVSTGWLVEGAEGSFIRLSRWGEIAIIDTSSPEFVSASLSESQSAEVLEFVTSSAGAPSFVRTGE